MCYIFVLPNMGEYGDSYLSVLQQIAPAPVTEQAIQKTEAAAPAESSKPIQEIVSPPKVDYATDLFDMLSMDGSGEKAAGASEDDNSWAGFQCKCLMKNS